jgi:hypothetical protein
MVTHYRDGLEGVIVAFAVLLVMFFLRLEVLVAVVVLAGGINGVAGRFINPRTLRDFGKREVRPFSLILMQRR